MTSPSFFSIWWLFTTQFSSHNIHSYCWYCFTCIKKLLHCLLILVVVWLYKVIKTFSFRECFVREWFTGRWRKGLFSIWYTLYASFIFLIVVFNRTKCRLTKRSQLCLSRVAPCWRVQVIRSEFFSRFIHVINHEACLVFVDISIIVPKREEQTSIKGKMLKSCSFSGWQVLNFLEELETSRTFSDERKTNSYF